MNPTLFSLYGVTVTLAKALSVTGLLADIVGVALLVWNEISSRKTERKEADRPIWDTPERNERKRAIGMHKDEFQEWIELRNKAQNAARMGKRAWCGVALIITGFLLQIGGAVLS